VGAGEGDRMMMESTTLRERLGALGVESLESLKLAPSSAAPEADAEAARSPSPSLSRLIDTLAPLAERPAAAIIASILAAALL
jgi:hypothetical protein